MLGLLSFFMGVVIGLVGVKLKNKYSLSVMTTLALVVFMDVVGAVILAAVTFSYANAEELAITRLRSTALHIAIGSGSVVEGKSGDNYILTNGHVCAMGNWHGRLRANYDNGVLLEGKITKQSMIVDLCAVKVGKGHAALKIGKVLYRNQQIYTRGYPYGVLSETTGQFLGATQWEYTYPIEEIGECFRGSIKERDGYGHISGCTVRYVDNVTNMYSRPGSSGSPVVNSQGDLVGVMSSWDSNRDAGGMVRLEDITEFMKDL